MSEFKRGPAGGPWEQPVDIDAQPLNRNFNAARLNDRVIDELIGLCKGVIADGVVSQPEAEFLQQWLRDNRQVSDTWPANMLYRRIGEFLADDVLDPEEQAELLTLLQDLTGGGHQAGAPSLASSLPLCDPPPALAFEGRVFCLTGKFVSGSRANMVALVESVGGAATSSPTKKVDYLVIGEVGSRDWIHSTHGRKIEKAMHLRDGGHGIAILSEEYLMDCLAECAPA